MTHEATDTNRVEIERLAGLGIPIKMIASIIGIADKTLSKYYGIEFDRGKASANAKIAECLFNKAIGGDTTSLIFWAKTQMQWKETTVQETVSYSDLSDEELDAKINEYLAARK